MPPAQSPYVCSASPLDIALTKRYSRDITPSPKKHKTQRVTFGDLVLPSGHNYRVGKAGDGREAFGRRLLLGFLADWMSGSAYGCHLFFSFRVSMPAGGPSG